MLGNEDNRGRNGELDIEEAKLSEYTRDFIKSGTIVVILQEFIPLNNIIVAAKGIPIIKDYNSGAPREGIGILATKKRRVMMMMIMDDDDNG